MSKATGRRHTARVHGTQTARRAKRWASKSGLCRAADEFNEAFDKVFCKNRPWLNQGNGWHFDPSVKGKKAAP